MTADQQQTEGDGVDRRATSIHLVVILRVTCEASNPAGAMSDDLATMTTPEAERADQSCEYRLTGVTVQAVTDISFVSHSWSGSFWSAHCHQSFERSQLIDDVRIYPGGLIYSKSDHVIVVCNITTNNAFVITHYKMFKLPTLSVNKYSFLSYFYF